MGQIQWSVDTGSIGPALEGKQNAIIAALTQRTTAINEALQAKVTGEKLSGQVLQQRTGKTIQSVRVIPTENDGETITGGVQAGGGPAFYFKFQEEGTAPYTIEPTDPKGFLAFMIGGKQVFAKKVNHPGLKARHPMQSTLDESRDAILESLQDAASEAAAE